MANSAIHNETTFHVGDTIDVHYKLIEKETVAGKAKREVKEELRERIQIFEGIVLSIKGVAENKSFTVRRIGAGAIGIERIFPLSSPWIKKIAVKRLGRVRRAKLYYLRDRVGKEAIFVKEQLEESQGVHKKPAGSRKIKVKVKPPIKENASSKNK